MTGFKNILLGSFIVVFVFAILVFSGVINFGSSSTQQVAVTVTLWGPFPNDAIQTFLIDYNAANPNTQIAYTQVPEDGLHQRLVEAIANGQGPDMVVFSSENFLQDVSKLYVTPYQAYAQRTFQDTYIEGASLFLNDVGVVLYPLLTDPMVVYYNKDLLAGAKYIYPPRTWSALNQSVPLFLKKDKLGITQSAIALGESLNMPHFKKILTTLFLQSGIPLISFDDGAKRYVVALDTEQKGGDKNPTPQEQAFMYYQAFSNPTNPLYSWSKKLDIAQDAFIAGKTTFYLAPSSELFSIQQKNPNLNFDVSGMFQPDNAIRPLTYGKVYGIGILKNSPHIANAFGAITSLTSKDTVDILSKQISLPPARRDLLQSPPQNPYAAVFFDQALHTFAWPDPDTIATDNAFRDMIRKSASGEWEINQSLYETQKQIQALIQ
jgi:ABC-type glycerol-3-phosphate transport system substrate-binding protein